MTFILKTFRELDNEQKEEFFRFCHTAWSDDPATANLRDLESILKDEHERFRSGNGEFYIAYDGKIIGCSGVYLSDFSKHVALIGARSWLIPKYRGLQLVRDKIMPVQRRWAIENGAKIVALTFNKYNLNLKKFVERRVKYPTNPRTEEMMFFKNIQTLDYPVSIQYTPQWTVYEKLEDWDFDWERIRAVQTD